MTRRLLIVGVLVLIAAACKGVCDALQFHGVGQGDWWNPEVSWRNKWADGVKANGEAFPLSSTLLVFTTDAWHFFQMVQYRCYDAAILVLVWPHYRRWVLALIALALFAIHVIGFHSTYSTL